MAASTPGKLPTLRFRNFDSFVDVSFFQELSRLKLDELRLSDEPIPIGGYYTVARSGEAPRMRFGAESFEGATINTATARAPPAAAAAAAAAAPPAPPAAAPPTTAARPDCRAPGQLLNVNTQGDFKAIDKTACLQALGDVLWQDITSGRAVERPELLTPFQLISFADLKRHHFFYWFGFPALSFPRDCAPLLEKLEPLSQRLEPSAVGELRRGLRTLRRAEAAATTTDTQLQAPHHSPFFLIVPGSGGLRVVPLSAWEGLSSEEKASAMFGFLDPCGVQDVPGWPLRNFLVLLTSLWGLSRATVVCYRGVVRHLNPTERAEGEDDDDDKEEDAASVILSLQLLPGAGGSSAARSTIGWEPNARGKMGPRRMDLSSMMDAGKLAEASADLNLKLMRWRAIPALDTDLLQNTRCLLLGSGTLGCGVARTLLGWGVRHMTFVDNGRVSYSNPVRQALFEFADCAQGGKPKAEAAAEAMRRIFPGVNTAGHTLTIPMPGHSVETELEEAKAATEKLDELVRSHDVTFLLTDTRESRWLPTVLCSTYDKCLIDVALGQESFLVIRHGAGALHEEDANGAAAADVKRLGCYFCNDCVAPRNSQSNRTLDQQCSTTRPGLAPISSAMAVELMVALLHHPKRHHAPSDEQAPPMSSQVSPQKPLGALPHQLRGFLSTWGVIQPRSDAFESCTACSYAIAKLYAGGGFDFVRAVCKDTNYLEECSGLKAWQDAADAQLDALEDDDDDDF